MIRKELGGLTDGQRWTTALLLLAVGLFLGLGLPRTRILANDTVTGSLGPPAGAPGPEPVAVPGPNSSAAVVPTPVAPAAIGTSATPSSVPLTSRPAVRATATSAVPRPVAPTRSAPVPPTPTGSAGCGIALPDRSSVPLPGLLGGLLPSAPVPLPSVACPVCDALMSLVSAIPFDLIGLVAPLPPICTSDLTDQLARP